MLNTIHKRLNSFHMHDDLREIWFILASTACVPLSLPPVEIIGSINTTWRHRVHNSFKKRKKGKKKKNHSHIIGTVQCFRHDREDVTVVFVFFFYCNILYIYAIIPPAALKWKAALVCAVEIVLSKRRDSVVSIWTHDMHTRHGHWRLQTHGTQQCVFVVQWFRMGLPAV